MPLTQQQRAEIEQIIVTALRDKLNNYDPGPAFKPFQEILLGKDRLAFSSFIDSLNTNFGTKVFETIALKIAKPNFKVSQLQVPSKKIISRQADLVISDIMHKLSTKKITPNKNAAIEQIRAVCQTGDSIDINPANHDLFLESDEGEFYLIDIKTVKPNKGQSEGFKRTLLEWYAGYFYEKPDAVVNGIIAMPYNPYEDKPYNWGPPKGMLNLDDELLVAEGFWDLIGGPDTYTDLLGCFRRAGAVTRVEVDNRLAQFNQ